MRWLVAPYRERALCISRENRKDKCNIDSLNNFLRIAIEKNYKHK